MKTLKRKTLSMPSPAEALPGVPMPSPPRQPISSTELRSRGLIHKAPRTPYSGLAATRRNHHRDSTSADLLLCRRLSPAISRQEPARLLWIGRSCQIGTGVSAEV